MSTSDLRGQRQSWRGQQKSGGNRWIGRILFSLVAAALLILFLCIIFWPRPERQLHAFLIHAKANAGAYQTHVIMPPMYGATAAATIKDRINPIAAGGTVEITGTVDDIKRTIGEKISPTLEDKDDTVLIVFRGYLLEGTDGPAIACSDFGANLSDASAGHIAGLLPLEEIFDQLSKQIPDSFQGTRLVVLDIEPLTAMPELNQYDDQIFQALEATVKNQAGHLWVLVTRGPFQNVGWDAKQGLPITTQTLLDAVTGDANRQEDNDYQLDLRELVTYTAQRYQKLDGKRGANLPTPLLLRGGIGRIKEAIDVDAAWIARARNVEAPEPSQEAEQDAPEPSDASNNKVTQEQSAAGLNLTPVVFHAAQDKDPSADSDDIPNSDSSVGKQADDDAQVKADKELAANDDAPSKPKAANNGQASPQEPDTFWKFRDRFESLETGGLTASGTRPSPIAIAPDIWKRLTQVVLHAEIESFDSMTAESSAQVLQPALIGIRQLDAIMQANDSVRQLNKSEVVSEIGQLHDAWKGVQRDDTGRTADRNVNVADRLQHAIVVANMRKWGWQAYQQEAIGIGIDVTSPFDSDKTLTDAISVLADQRGDTADESAMRRVIRAISQIVARSDKSVNDSITELLSDFERAATLASDKSLSAEDIKHISAWREVRDAHAWLRSSLPTAGQRNELRNAIAKARVDTDLDDPPETYFDKQLSLANVTTDEGRRLRKRDGDESELWESIGLSPNLNGQTEEPSFAQSLSLALRRTPMNTVIKTSPTSIIHAVVPPPRIPKPTMSIVDSGGSPVDGKVRLRATNDYLDVKLNPDSDTPTQFRLGIVNESRGSKTDVKWSKDGRELADPEITITVPANATVGYRLNITAPDATLVATKVPISITVEPINAPDRHVESLKTRRPLDLLLPQPDQIRVVVKTDGLTDQDQHVSGESFQNGVWLRTFVSRPTQFAVSAYNDSGKPCRAHVWLLKLEHPFLGEDVGEYFPDVVKSRVNQMSNALLDADQRVPKRVLEGELSLRGPQLISFASDRVPSSISWQPKPATEGSASEGADPPLPRDPFPEGGLDVRHGMALVFRLINQEDAPIGADQIVWMVPKPWSPEDYVDIDFLDSSRNGLVKVRPAVRQRVDGDNQPDKVPKINQKPIEVQWLEDQIGSNFRAGTAIEPTTQSVGPGGLINVQLRRDIRSPVLRLGVDGWPRALRWQINESSPTESKKELGWHTVQFASVTMDYGDKPPGEDDDEKIEPTMSVFNPPRSRPIYFRGGGKSVKVKVHADISTTYPEATLKFMDGTVVFQTHRSDRKFRTVINEIKETDDSPMILTTTVADLDFESTAATYKDAEVLFRAQVDTGATGSSDDDEAELSIHLDSTRPQVNLRVSPANGPYYEGSKVVWIADYLDGGDVPSGVKQINFGEDMGDGKPGGKKRNVRRSDEERIEMKLKPGMESVAMAVQVWDQVGLASRPVHHSIRVEKPKPKQSPQMADSSKPSGAKKNAPPKIKRGNVTIRINTRSTMRGEFKLSPAPSKMLPSDGIIEWQRSKPTLLYSSVPEGGYALAFEGTINGSSKTKTWEGLTVEFDRNGGSMNLDLDP